jgi:hypothetical protein
VWFHTVWYLYSSFVSQQYIRVCVCVLDVPAHSELWRFRENFSATFPNLFRRLAGLLVRGVGPSQGLYLHRDGEKHSCLKWDSNPRFQCSRGQDPLLRPRATVSLLQYNGVCNKWTQIPMCDASCFKYPCVGCCDLHFKLVSAVPLSSLRYKENMLLITAKIGSISCYFRQGDLTALDVDIKQEIAGRTYEPTRFLCFHLYTQASRQ